MKRDDLIAALSAHVEPVDHRSVGRAIHLALAAATVLTFGAILVALGIRSDLTTGRAVAFLLLKMAVAIATVALASVCLMRLARPGGEHRSSLAWAIVPFAGIVLLAAINLELAPSSHWNKMVMGDEWLECVISIPIIAIVPFAAVIAAVRTAAPTNLVRTGAFAGLVSGGISAMGYSLHCTDDSLPLWQSGTAGQLCFARSQVRCWAPGCCVGSRTSKLHFDVTLYRRAID